jgi:hypothetical protein
VQVNGTCQANVHANHTRPVVSLLLARFWQQKHKLFIKSIRPLQTQTNSPWATIKIATHREKKNRKEFN